MVIQTEIVVLAGDETHAEIVAKHVVEDEWPARDHCHRRLVAEYLREKWGNVEITYL